MLQPGEIIAAIVVPAETAGQRSHYLKVRDRASFEFALVSAAVAVSVTGGRIDRRADRDGRGRHQAVAAARGRGGARRRPGDARCLCRGRGTRGAGARPLSQNRFKLALMQRALVRALTTATA